MAARLELFFLLFFTYSVLGWCIEVAMMLRQFRRFVNRGFLIGPYCPIYGVGALGISLLLSSYVNDPPVLFCMSVILCSALEYFTSWAMEKLFHARWWDYSGRRFNLNGRICLSTMIPFGLLGMVMMYALNPALTGLFSRLSATAAAILCGLLAAGFLADVVVSACVLSHVRRDASALDGDHTEEMSARVRAAIASRGWAHRRLLDAFPQVRHIGHVIKEGAVELRDTVYEGAAELRDTVYEGTAGAREKLTETASGAWDRLADGAFTAKDKLTETASGAWDRLADGAAGLRDTVYDGAFTAKDKLTETASDAWDRLADGAAGLRDTVYDGAYTARDKLTETASETRLRMLEAELRRLEASHARAEADYQRRRQELHDKMDRLSDPTGE